MLTDAALFLLDTIGGLFVVALLLRFYLQLLRAPHRNPLSPFLQALTNFIVLPARRVIPGLWGLDLATLLIAWLVELFLISATLWLNGAFPSLGPQNASVMLLLAAVGVVKRSIQVFTFSIIVQAVLSWTNPYNPLSSVLQSLTRPFLGFFRRFIPPVGNVDLSPLLVLIAL